ncbi:MAG: glycosyltransferase, partial [Armatimonadota bacterium]|nr:glycosyltransferase [Armatimonadota bacterium]
MSRIAILCQSSGRGGRWHVRRLPYLVRNLTSSGHEVVLLGFERQRARGPGLTNLTGRLWPDEILDQVAACDLAVCVDEQCYPAARAQIPLLGLFFDHMHLDLVPAGHEALTAIYPSPDGDLASIAPSFVAEQAPARLHDEVSSRRIIRPRVGMRPVRGRLWSIIVLAHDLLPEQCESTRRCLEAIRANTSVSYEIVVVDRGSRAATTSVLKSGDVRPVFLRGPGGTAEAICAGASAAAGDVLVLLHNDHYVREGWEEPYLGALEDGAALVGAEARCIGLEGVLRAHSDGPRTFPAFGGAAVARAALRDVGGFRPTAMPESAALADTCWRLQEFGYSVAALEEVAIDHIGGLTRPRGRPPVPLLADEPTEIASSDALRRLLVRWPDRLADGGGGSGRLAAMNREAVLEAGKRWWLPWPDAAKAFIAAREDPMTGDAGRVGRPQATTFFRPDRPPAEVVVISAGAFSDTGGAQRPAQLARAFSKAPGDVLHVSHHDASGMVGDVIVSGSDDFLRLLVPNLREGSGAAIFGFADLAWLADELGPNWITVFDLFDDWEAFAEAGHLPGFDRSAYVRAISGADLVTCSARTLVEIAKEHGAERTALVRNAGPDRPFGESPRPAGFLEGDITVIFVGSLWGTWLDWEAFEQLADDLREYDGAINVVGGPGRRELQRHPNIRWHGVLPYYQAMAHAAASDVGLVPFGEGAITEAVDPIKYYDYTAARCRTVATSAMTELRGRKYCHLGEPGELID